MRIFTVYLCGFLLAFLGACSSGKKSLEHGNYYQAVEQSVSRLKNSSSNAKAQETLAQAFPLAVQKELDDIQRNSTNTAQVFRWEKVVDSYENLNRLYSMVNSSPAARNIIPNARHYDQDLVEAKKLAAQERYQAGVDALNRQNREDAKKAYQHFQKAHALVPNYNNDVVARMEEAQWAATIKVVVEQIPVTSMRYAVNHEIFQQEVMNDLKNFKANAFISFFTPQEAEGLRLTPDHVLKLQFVDFTIGETHTKEVIENFSDSVKKEVTIDGVKKTIKEKVTAQVVNYQKSVRSWGVLNMMIMDWKNQSVVYQRNLSGEYLWDTKWGHYNGDKRVIPDNKLANCEKKESNPPSKDILFTEFSKVLFWQLRSQVKDYYRNM